MREFGVVRKGFDGDVEAAKEYIGMARTQLGILKNAMSFNNLQQLSRKIQLSDGTTIFVSSIFGQDTIRIEVPPGIPRKGGVHRGLRKLKQLVIVGGSTVPGTTTIDGMAYRWIKGKGMESLGTLPGYSNSRAFAVSGNGAVPVGVATTSGGGNWVVCKWRKVSGVWKITALSPAANRAQQATGVSYAGSVIVGNNGASDSAFIWSEKTGLVDLGFLPGDNVSEAAGVSADGKVVAGRSYSTLGGGTYGTLNESYKAFRWTAKTGMVDLGFLPGFFHGTNATAISADGLVIAGYSTGARSWRWTAKTGMVELFSSETPTGLSHDGKVLAGYAAAGIVSSGYFWTPKLGSNYLPYSSVYHRDFVTGVVAEGEALPDIILCGNGVYDAADNFSAFYWTDKDGFVPLGFLPGAGQSVADAIVMTEFEIPE